jgi:hypothetical protein
MNFESKKYQVKGSVEKLDYIKITFYDRVRKIEVAVTGSELPGLKILPEFVNMTLINEELDEVGYSAAKGKYQAEKERLAEKFVLDLLENEGLPDNPFTRSLVSRCLAREDSYADTWDLMYRYTEIYREAEKFFKGE